MTNWWLHGCCGILMFISNIFSFCWVIRWVLLVCKISFVGEGGAWCTLLWVFCCFGVLSVNFLVASASSHPWCCRVHFVFQWIGWWDPLLLLFSCLQFNLQVLPNWSVVSLSLSLSKLCCKSKWCQWLDFVLVWSSVLVGRWFNYIGWFSKFLCEQSSFNCFKWHLSITIKISLFARELATRIDDGFKNYWALR